VEQQMTESGNSHRNSANKKRRTYNKRRNSNKNPNEHVDTPEKNGNMIAPREENMPVNNNDGQSQLLPQTVTIKANDFTQACQEAMMTLNIHDESLLGHEIVEKGKRNFFGLLGSREMTYKFFIVPKTDIMTQNFLENIVKLSFLDVTFNVQQSDNLLEVNFEGTDAELLKDRGFELITCIEQLTRKFLVKKAQIKGNFIIKFSVQGEVNSKELRLESLAQRMKEKVLSKGKSIVLKSMSPRDRRIIHQYLDADDQVKTKSLGDGHYKRIKIYSVSENRPNTSEETTAPETEEKNVNVSDATETKR